MTDSEALTEARVREIMGGCKGVTPGPWLRHESPQETSVQWQNGTVVIVPWGRSEHNLANAHRDADYIARLDPNTVRALCTLALSALGTAPAVGSTEFALRGNIREAIYQAEKQRPKFDWNNTNGEARQRHADGEKAWEARMFRTICNEITKILDASPAPAEIRAVTIPVASLLRRLLKQSDGDRTPTIGASSNRGSMPTAALSRRLPPMGNEEKELVEFFRSLTKEPNSFGGASTVVAFRYLELAASTIERLSAIEQERDALREALDGSQSLLTACLHEQRERAEIEQQIGVNRVALNQTRTHASETP